MAYLVRVPFSLDLSVHTKKHLDIERTQNMYDSKISTSGHSNHLFLDSFWIEDKKFKVFDWKPMGTKT